MCFYSFSSVWTELTWIKCNKGMIADFQHPINFISAWLHEYERVCACVGPALLGRTFNPFSFRSSYTDATHACCVGVCRRKRHENHLSLFPEGLWCTKGYFGSYQLGCFVFQVVLIIFFIKEFVLWAWCKIVCCSGAWFTKMIFWKNHHHGDKSKLIYGCVSATLCTTVVLQVKAKIG